MPSAKIKVTTTAQVIDWSHDWYHDMELGVAEAMREMAEVGKIYAISEAPKGHKPRDGRGPSIVEGMYSDSTARTASWGTHAIHGLAVELGAKPHPITGWVSFYWDKLGRRWNPGPNMINHPGNRAQPYLAPSFDYITQNYLEYLRTNMRKHF